ncbi:MAG: DUF4437 domain-containing protein [Gammaproteobacteria bacterium]|nr:DUF4437 domain-containing protein [Gammaproteobacteria bacterium]
MRPHVELIQQVDLCWHVAELPRSQGDARQRNMSYDEEDGSASTLVHFDSAWSRPGGYHHADTEWYILSGRVKLGERLLTKGMYFRAPAGLCVPAMTADAGTEVLLFREYGDWGFSVSKKNRSKFVPRGLNTLSKEPGSLTVVDVARLDWLPNIYEGDTQRYLKLKMLYHDQAPPDQPRRGFMTMICWAPPGWSDSRLVHHPVFEEAYSLEGRLDYNFGPLGEGTYFFRPAKVKHGHFTAGEEKGYLGIFRLDGSLINWITVEERVIVEGKAINYDPVKQAPLMAGIPVRSRSVGEWDLDGQ